MRLGFVDHHLENYHANVFLELIRTAFADRGIEVIGYESDPAAGPDWCEQHQVRRAESIEALVDQVDAILILAPDDIGTHRGFAEAAIRGARPVVFDKLLAETVEDAERIAELARRHDAPVLSSSALWYAAELAELRADDAPVESAFARGFGAWDHYGIHTLAMAARLGGSGVRRALEAGTAEDRLLVLDYGDRRVTVDCRTGANAADELGWSAGVRVGGEWRVTKISDYAGFYRRTLAAYLDFCAGAGADQGLDQALELVRLHAAADRSLAGGGSWVDLG